MKEINTRTLQYHLRECQIKLDTCTDYALREAYKQHIADLATELLYRWRKEMQTLTA